MCRRNKKFKDLASPENLEIKKKANLGKKVVNMRNISVSSDYYFYILKWSPKKESEVY